MVESVKLIPQMVPVFEVVEQSFIGTAVNTPCSASSDKLSLKRIAG